MYNNTMILINHTQEYMDSIKLSFGYTTRRGDRIMFERF